MRGKYLRVSLPVSSDCPAAGLSEPCALAVVCDHSYACKRGGCCRVLSQDYRIREIRFHAGVRDAISAGDGAAARQEIAADISSAADFILWRGDIAG